MCEACTSTAPSPASSWATAAASTFNLERASSAPAASARSRRHLLGALRLWLETDEEIAELQDVRGGRHAGRAGGLRYAAGARRRRRRACRSSSSAAAQPAQRWVRRLDREPCSLLREVTEKVRAAVGERCADQHASRAWTPCTAAGGHPRRGGRRRLWCRCATTSSISGTPVGGRTMAEWGDDAGASRFFKAGHETPYIGQGAALHTEADRRTWARFVTSPDDMVAPSRAASSI